jgi:hypothetical protein
MIPSRALQPALHRNTQEAEMPRAGPDPQRKKTQLKKYI